MKKIFNGELPMQVVAFGSGSCSTIDALIERQKLTGIHFFRVVALFTDNRYSRAHKIGIRENIPVVYNHLDDFMKEKGMDYENKKERKDKDMRKEFDERSRDLLLDASDKHNFSIDLVALAGYMLRLYSPLLSEFSDRMINSHPADLSILKEDGKRKYTGDNAVLDAILGGENETRTSIHMVRDKVDAGEILVMSKPLPVERYSVDMARILCRYVDDYTKKYVLDKEYARNNVPEDKREISDDIFFKYIFSELFVKKHQELQKHVCDFPAYCFALEEIAKGSFELDNVSVFYKGEKLSYKGVCLE